MKVWIAATYSPRGSNDQPMILGVFSTRDKSIAAVNKRFGSDIEWDKSEFFDVDEDGSRYTDYDGEPSPAGGVFAVTLDKQTSEYVL